MVEELEVLAIVPARGGSKSLPRKNLRQLAGHPLVAYSIAAGLQSEVVSRLIVSTDDEEIAQVSRLYGAEIPFMRPKSLAADDTLDLPVFQHALTTLGAQGYKPDVVVQLRPTSPLRPPDCIDQAVKLLLGTEDADSVRAVVPSSQNPYKMWRIKEDGRLTPLLGDGKVEAYNMPRQKLPSTFWQTGHLDVIRTRTILEMHSMSGALILPLVLDPRYSIDIDTERDWERAEWIVKQFDLPAVRPGHKPRPLPDQVELVVLDFDGVMTDNRVWVDSDGREAVVADRGDGLGISRLLARGIDVVVLSSEINPVVSARCRKLGVPVFQGTADKGSALRDILTDRSVDPARAVFLGNDLNDVPCFELVGCALVVADSHPDVASKADFILTRPGGHGAVRELSDLLLSRMED
jgi:YrbI family 3-deoxy-D-manno-octulosonate 8-phosphate phosphatase